MIHVIWAQAKSPDGQAVIGAAGSIPWHVPEDFAHFRAMTMGHPVIMGRRTWESLPVKARPLPGRTNIVVTRQPDRDALRNCLDVACAQSVDMALSMAARASGGSDIWIIGGEQLYRAVLPQADECVITDIELVVRGDTFAPALGEEWCEENRTPWRRSQAGVRYRVRWMQRRGA